MTAGKSRTLLPPADRDDAAFRDAMNGVTPLESPEKVPAGRRAVPSDRARQRRIDAATEQPALAADPNRLTLGTVPDVKPLEVLAWKQGGVQERVFRKLKQGRYDIDATLDLHGKTVKEARVAVHALLTRATARGFRCVIIAHGRGEQSTTPARLKSYVACWLRDSREVIAYHSAARHHGGTGAVYALLVRARTGTP